MTEKIVSVSIANLYAEPSFRSELLTQAFLGEKLKVLTDNGHWLKVVCPDDYIGWIHINSLNESAPHFSEVLKKHLLHANRFGNCYNER